MNIGIKITALIIAGACIIGGSVLAGVTACSLKNRMENEDYQQEGSERYVRSEEKFSPIGLNKLYVEENNNAVRLERSVDGDIHVSYCVDTKSGEHYDITAENGRLSVIYKQPTLNISWFNGIPAGLDDTLIISLPEGFEPDADINSENGKITAADLSFGPLSAKADNGKVELSGIKAASVIAESVNGAVEIKNTESAGKVYAKSDNGKITYENVSATDTVEAYTDNGAVTLDSVSTNGSITCESDNGKLQLTDVKAASVNANTDNGTVGLDNVAAANELSASTQNGAIKFSGISAKKRIALKTEDGAVLGSVAGREDDYSVLITKDNGSSNLESHLGGDIELNVNTGNGSIKIEFEEA